MFFVYGLYAPQLDETRDSRGGLAYMDTLPEEMRLWAERRNIRQTRRGVAEAAGIGTSTLTRLLDEGKTSRETVRKVAEVLGVETNDIYQLAGLSDGKSDPWLPPLRESFLIKPEVRKALDLIVRSLARAAEPEGEEVEDARQAEAHNTDGEVTSLLGNNSQTDDAKRTRVLQTGDPHRQKQAKTSGKRRRKDQGEGKHGPDGGTPTDT